MNAEILAVGTEILLGDIVNTNAQFLARQLAELGIDVYAQGVVGDNQKRLLAYLKGAFARSELLIATGGLGPTVDDITKETAAAFFHKELVLDERALKRIEKYFKKTGRKMTENNQKQAYVPEGAKVLYNENGTAPGLILEEQEKILVLLPGPPREAVPMFQEQVRPYLAEKQEYTFVSRVLRVAEVGESAMETAVRDLLDEQTNPTIAPYAKPTESLLRITAKAKTKSEAEAKIAPVAAKVYERLKNAVYGEGEDTSLAEVVTKMIIKRNMTISVCESCTGGLLSAAFVEHPGISKVYCSGHTTYSNKAKTIFLGVKQETLDKYTAVSPEVAREMVEGVTEAAGTDIGISITGYAGPESAPDQPVGLVYIGLSIDGEVEIREYHFLGGRQQIRERAVYAALNWLRLSLLDMEEREQQENS